MKKTIRTVLTAAMFASANMAALPSSAVGETDNQANEPTASEVLTEVTDSRKPMPIYGPPEVMSTMSTTAQETFTTTTTTFMHSLYGPPWMFTTTESTTSTEAVTTTMPEVLYGPPVYYKLLGDVNLDQQIDSFDAIALRRMLVTGKAQNFASTSYGDINRDGKVSIADLLMLQRYLLGELKTLNSETEYIAGIMRGAPIEKIEKTAKPDDKITTTTTTAYDPGNDLIVTLYGISPIKDIVKDIRGDIEAGVDAIADSNDTTSQEK
ncbi:MAG: dockerin type I repeat-containing protein [Ruminococcus sp.]|uniref:dockerin type I repeat-containing protein n=1 Tax=Ruminococcus sp. TaxID=41978 RepID=UPI0025F5FF63|nr:dockerin type I repeat-containing protein [Ruminococcus sp.]MCR5599210.1 dockerin type I repeat-containing protein [Ruminococcus sp.]